MAGVKLPEGLSTSTLHVRGDPAATLYVCAPMPSTVIRPVPPSAFAPISRLFFTAKLPTMYPSAWRRSCEAFTTSPGAVATRGIVQAWFALMVTSYSTVVGNTSSVQVSIGPTLQYGFTIKVPLLCAYVPPLWLKSVWLVVQVPPTFRSPLGAVKSPATRLKACTEKSVVPMAGVKLPEGLSTSTRHVRGDPAATLYVCAPMPSTVIRPVPPSAFALTSKSFPTANCPVRYPSICRRSCEALTTSPGAVAT